jgi:iron complex outermembrane receptor protein
LQWLDLGALKLEGGARYEHSAVAADADAGLGNPALRRAFDAFSGSLGASYAIASGVRVGINGSHSERAPSAEELFANGPHAGTQAFEIGDPDLKVEKSWGLEGTLHASGDGYRFGASIYRSWFRNYIFDQATGAVADDLPVFQNFQADARYFGFEAEASFRLARIDGVALMLEGVADYTRATIKGVGPAPRIPPLRLLGGVEADGDTVQGRLEAEWVSSQDRLAANETPTDSYVMVNGSLSFQPFKGGNKSTITISVNNIFDVDARRHASVLKDFAPLAGRDIRITAHVSL